MAAAGLELMVLRGFIRSGLASGIIVPEAHKLMFLRGFVRSISASGIPGEGQA